MTKPLKLAVVGHTNVGKTSLLRTLLRDVGFGEVSHRPSTTRHVEGARLSVDGEALLELYDTPGLEDAIALLEHLERLERPGERLDGPARIGRFLDGPEARQRFEQEAKVLRQLLASDAGLYVIDAREPVLAKYKDELAVLAGCGKPLLPVLNFIHAANQREGEWREALARLGLHARVAFDTVAPPLDGERRLYESLALLIESARPQLERLIADHEAQAEARRQAGARLIAELLLDCAACRRSVATQPQIEQGEIAALHQAVRQREQQCVDALLRLYAFRRDDARAAALVQEHSDIVLFANYRISTVKADVGFNKKVSRAVGSGERVIHTTERPAFLAKNRYGLPDTLPLDWQAFAQAMPEAIQPLLMTAPVAAHATTA